MTRRPRDYKPIEFRQLCAVVKMLLQQAPQIDDAEWKARTRDHLQKLGFDEPDSEQLSRAMTQVEYALRQTVGPRMAGRPVPEPVRAQPEPKPDLPKEARTNKPAGWEIVQAMMGRLRRVSPVLEPTSPQQPVARQVLGITEEVALDEFWRQMRADADKLEWLRAYAELALIRPADWDYTEIRSEFEQLRFSPEPCFVCHYRKTDRHHIIQIQHGGSNYARNLVPLCERCHGTVHPWLGAGRRPRLEGWSQLSEINVDDAIEKKARPA